MTSFVYDILTSFARLLFDQFGHFEKKWTKLRHKNYGTVSTVDSCIHTSDVNTENDNAVPAKRSRSIPRGLYETEFEFENSEIAEFPSENSIIKRAKPVANIERPS